ncbi:hypothetical protein BDR07DRAFT_1488030 [Suillus spraguei]|nr:hypothetical protein BDR07DRAFT_1488030 [Suillus spraguei]
MSGHSAGVRAVAASRDGQWIESGDDDGNLISWKLGDTCQLTRVIMAHSKQILSLNFSPNHAVLTTSSLDQDLKLWSTSTWTQLGDTIPSRCCNIQKCSSLATILYFTIGNVSSTPAWMLQPTGVGLRVPLDVSFKVCWLAIHRLGTTWCNSWRRPFARSISTNDVVITGERTGRKRAIKTRYDLSLWKKNSINVQSTYKDKTYISVSGRRTEMFLRYRAGLYTRRIPLAKCGLRSDHASQLLPLVPNFSDSSAMSSSSLSAAIQTFKRSVSKASTRTVVRISAPYTPLKQQEDLPPVLYEPVTRKPPCRAILNPQIDIRGKLWSCPFCLTCNAFPPHYKDTSNTNLPAELLPKYTTIEYTLSRPAQAPPVFLFVVDTCLDTEDLKALRGALVVSLSLILPYALVGLITFGTVTQVHELGHAKCSKSHVFRGGKEYTQKQIQDMLGLSTTARAALHPALANPYPNKLLNPPASCFLSSNANSNSLRALRCTGVAVSAAIGSLETTFLNTGTRIMVFVGGPATEGPGMVVSNELKEPICSHHDIERDGVKHYKRALKFYEGPAKRASNNGHAVDLFAGCLDQVGLLEMKSLPNSTNGVIVLSDSFATSILKQSLLRMFNKDDQDFLQMGFNVTFDTTKESKFSGLIGHAISAGKKSACVGETEIGIGQTSAWRINSITPRSSAAIYFEVVTPAGQPFSTVGLYHRMETSGDTLEGIFEVCFLPTEPTLREAGTTTHNACISWDFLTADRLLTQEINADNNNHNSGENCSYVRASWRSWGASGECREPKEPQQLTYHTGAW